MTAVVSLQRAINVGRGRSVPMAELKAVYELLGCSNVRTFLQSGNVVFDSDGDVVALSAKLEAALARRFGFAIPVINRTGAELKAIIRQNPFPEAAAADPAHMLVVFLPDVPSAAEQEALARPIDGPERLKLIGPDLYIHYAAGVGRSKLKLPPKMRGTGRNWTTVTTLAAMAAAEGGAMNSQPRRATLKSGAVESSSGEDVMAKGQMKSNKEKRKPKADKKPKGAAPMAMSGASSGAAAGKKK